MFYNKTARPALLLAQERLIEVASGKGSQSALFICLKFHKKLRVGTAGLRLFVWLWNTVPGSVYSHAQFTGVEPIANG
jgi:hypothetical protein